MSKEKFIIFIFTSLLPVRAICCVWHMTNLSWNRWQGFCLSVVSANQDLHQPQPETSNDFEGNTLKVLYVVDVAVLLLWLFWNRSDEMYMWIIRLPGTISSGRAYVLLVMYLFVSPLVLRAPSTDHPETLPHGRNLAEFYNPSPKTRGLSPKTIWGPKTCKISVNFGPLQTLIANISGTAEDIQNRKTVQTMAIPPAFNEKSPVNFGPLTAWNYMWVGTH